MQEPTCSVDGCDRKPHGRGWCAYHYNRWLRHGDTGPVRPVMAPAGNPWVHIDKEAPGGCWLWTGRRDEKGYGRTSFKGRPLQAHRFTYEQLIGSIPPGLDLDHLCRVTSCVNPSHLEPVTRRENLARSSLPFAEALRNNTCMRGHAFTPENTYIAPGKPRSRRCRTCMTEIRRLQRKEARRPKRTA